MNLTLVLLNNSPSYICTVNMSLSLARKPNQNFSWIKKQLPGKYGTPEDPHGLQWLEGKSLSFLESCSSSLDAPDFLSWNLISLLWFSHFLIKILDCLILISTIYRRVKYSPTRNPLPFYLPLYLHKKTSASSQGSSTALYRRYGLFSKGLPRRGRTIVAFI